MLTRDPGRESPRVFSPRAVPAILALVEPLFLLPGAVPHEPAIDAWLDARPLALGALARPWVARLRACGADVRETMHDGAPTACVGDAAFAYVAAFTAHVNVGFFFGAFLPDPAGLLEGTGKRMRHVKLRPGVPVDEHALGALVTAACADVRERVRRARGGQEAR